MLARMLDIALALEDTARLSDAPLLDRFRASIEPGWIEEALEATGTATVRKRRLPAEQVIWLVLGMCLQRDLPIHGVVTKLDLVLPGAGGSRVIAPSAAAKARQRLGPDPVKWLFEKTAATWMEHTANLEQWRGLALFGLDGSTLRVADTDENRAHFGLAKGRNGASGYPLVRLVMVIGLRSRLLAAAQFGAYKSSELTLTEPLWSTISDNSLTIVDKAFYSAEALLGLQRGGTNRNWLLRARKSAKWDELDSYGRNDRLVELTVSKAARAKNPALPKTFRARAIRYQHPGSKGPQWLLTSLLDAQAYPANEIVALYHERWELELGYDEIKTHLLEREETIRSRTVRGVEQEIWAILLTYNLIRLEMVNVAKIAKVRPARISFVGAMRAFRDAWITCAISASPGAFPKRLNHMREEVAHFVLPPRRSKRSYPRAVKIQSSGYAKKNPHRGLK